MNTDNWKNRSGEMICKTCISFVYKKDTIGRCRKHAPAMNGFPVVYDTDWCGDHRIDEYKIAMKNSIAQEEMRKSIESGLCDMRATEGNSDNS